jgi:signal transduction histidine kinase
MQRDDDRHTAGNGLPGSFVNGLLSALLGLPGRLLLLTILFVMLSEIFIFVPSIANFRLNWLRDRLAAASIATIAAKAAPDGALPEMLKTELLMRAGLRGIALKTPSQRRLILAEPMPPSIDASYDLDETTRFGSVMDALAVFFETGDRTIRVNDTVGMALSGIANGHHLGDEDMIEIVVDQAPLRAAMISWGLSILGLSVLISVLTAGLVYLSLYGLLVRPLRRLTSHIMSFARTPEVSGAVIVPSARRDEIGDAERELAKMQADLQALLKERSRLAALGLAVSKINHDLRNILSNAQLISDRLGTVEDPLVQRMTPKLIGSLDRAIRLCADTLNYGRAVEPDPVKQCLALAPIVSEVAESLGLPRPGMIEWRVSIDPDLEVWADADQLFRILSNLSRNSVQVLEGCNDTMQFISVSASGTKETTTITLCDSGPGVPARARDKLFVPFEGNVRPGGTGLGLAIVAELVQAHGGTVRLLDDVAGNGRSAGAKFEITLPNNPIIERRPAVLRTPAKLTAPIEGG